MGVDKRPVVGKGALIREGKELDTPKVVQLPPQTLVWGLEEATSSTGIARTKDVAETAKLVTAVNPSFVRFRTYCPIPGTEGYDALLNGDFEQLSETEHVQEMRDMIAALGPTCTAVVTAADHIGNLGAGEAKLPRQRGALAAHGGHQLGSLPRGRGQPPLLLRLPPQH